MASRVDRPSSLGKLVIEDMAGAWFADRGARAPQKRQQEKIFRFEDRVTLELTNPVAVGVLPGQEPGPGPILRGLDVVRCKKGVPARRQTMHEMIRGPVKYSCIRVGDHAFSTHSRDS